MVGPTFGFNGPRASAWEQATIHTFLQEPDAPGVHVCRGRFLSQPAGFVPPGADALAGFALCSSHDLPAGYNTGFWAEVPLVDMPPYLAHLAARCATIGIRIERHALASLDDALQLAPRIANCSGLGAHALVPDSAVVPSRGPKIVAENPGIDTFVAVGPPGPKGTSFHPHGAIVVLGGSATPSADTRPDPDEASAVRHVS